MKEKNHGIAHVWGVVTRGRDLPKEIRSSGQRASGYSEEAKRIESPRKCVINIDYYNKIEAEKTTTDLFNRASLAT